MESEPIRQPLVAHQKYLSQLNTNNPRQQKYCQLAMQPNEQDNINPSTSLSQDCSMSSYSSSGYDSMTQSPPSLSQNQTSRNQEQQYSTNYDNVRGHLRGPFVSYTNDRN